MTAFGYRIGIILVNANASVRVNTFFTGKLFKLPKRRIIETQRGKYLGWHGGKKRE
ncbi:MAG: hypothetical protein QF394_09400 [Rhodospirillales bacterium]|nr:hypothetical protein [Rhodospirillales bacterium]MDP7425620.1 hypothetical protein [Rhodospirillales bacterium]MDP7625200.1 hypothetical protein [Rhodospirillales bacterium]